MFQLEKLHIVVCILQVAGKEVFGQTKPSNAMAEFGGQAIFNCSGTSFLPNWVMSKDGTTKNQLPIAGSCNLDPNLQNHYKLEQIGGPTTCNLVVFNITMEQAGAYWCTDGVPSYALLTVIDKSPNTTYNATQGVVVENENVIITCTLFHNGSLTPAPTLRPYFYWTNPSGQNVSSSYDSTTDIMALSQLTVAAGRQAIMPFTCHVYLQLIPPNNPSYASNTPTVNNSITSPINVLYPIQLGDIISEERNSTKSSCGISTIVCSGTANPAANYFWVDMEDPDKIIHSSQLYDYAETGRIYGCNATNTIRNEIQTDEKTYKVEDQYGITPCKGCRSTNMNITGENCLEKKCGCLLNCDMTIHCYSDAYPVPSYKWKLDGQVILENSNVLKDPPNGFYSCVTMNVIEGITFEAEIAFEVVNCTNCSWPPWSTYPTYYPTTATNSTENTSQCSSAETAAIVLGVLLAISITAHIISLVVFYRKGAVNRRDSSHPEVAQPTSNPEEPHYQDLFKENMAKGPEYEELHH